MKHIYILFLIIIFSCNSKEQENKAKELELKAKELELREKEIRIHENNNQPDFSAPIQNNIGNTTPELPASSKFVYVTFLVKEPTLFHMDEKHYSTIGSISGTTIPESNIASQKDMVYSTEIKEFSTFNENAQYQYMDEMEAQLRLQFREKDFNFINEVNRYVDDSFERSEMESKKCQIIDRKIKTFDTYKDASVYRNNNKGVFK
jgi:hypothetical protein